MYTSHSLHVGGVWAKICAALFPLIINATDGESLCADSKPYNLQIHYTKVLEERKNE